MECKIIHTPEKSTLIRVVCKKIKITFKIQKIISKLQKKHKIKESPFSAKNLKTVNKLYFFSQNFYFFYSVDETATLNIKISEKNPVFSNKIKKNL